MIRDSDYDERHTLAHSAQVSDVQEIAPHEIGDAAAHRSYQETLLAYITHASASLRSYTEIDALLVQIAIVVQDIPGFHFSALYLDDKQDFCQIQVIPGNKPPQISYPQECALPALVVAECMHEAYRMGQAYRIPADAPLYEYAPVKQLLTSINIKKSLALTPEQMGDVIIVPLHGDTSSLLGFLIFAGPKSETTAYREAIPLLTIFANQIAIIMERTHLHEEIRRISEERVALIEVSHALSAPEALRDLQTVYHTIYEQVQRLMPVDAFLIDRYYSAQGILSKDYLVENGVIYAPPDDRYVPPFVNRFLWEEKYSRVFSTAQEFAAYQQNELADIRDTSKHFWGQALHQNVQSVMLLTLKYGEEPVGLLIVQSNQTHCYRQEHLNMLREIGMQAALAIKSTHMYSELRDALRQAQESERLKNHFLMTASHELRTPLTAIQGYLELLENFSQTLPGELKERFISNARRACEELVLLLGNVMDASRIDQDKVELKPGSLHIIEAVRTIIEILDPIITKERRPIEIQVPDQLYAWADDLRLRQILLNLVGNALKYTPAPTSIAIRAASMTYARLCQRFQALREISTLSNKKRYVVITVQDKGPGVAPEDQPLLFTKFMRLNDAINSPQRGAGLGLYLCRQLTEAMGGHIWMESSGIDGEGATFMVTLPLS